MRASLKVLGLLLAVTALGCRPGEGGPDGGGDAGSDVCEVGTAGCACSAESKCSKNGRGEQLVCQAGTCGVMNCAPGDRGCVCRGGTDCNGGDSCTNGFCVAAGCAVGSVNCSCLAGSCDVGAVCLENAICVDSAGYEGGACLANGRCNRGNRCDGSTNRCVFCSPGTQACQCNTNNSCNPGLACAAGTCLAANQLPPASPVCYTPCREDLTLDGGTVACTTDQTLPGCLIPGQTCNNGSCVIGNESKPTCTNDIECPFFQVCLAGGCYSNCDVNADCSAGMGCYRHACRTTCSTTRGSAACPSSYACTANDGENGYCLPVGRQAANATTSPLPTGGLELPIERLDLSNVKASGSFMVVSKSNATQDITVRKLWHQVTIGGVRQERVDAPLDSNGNFRECDPVRNECPLPWLKIAVPGAQPVQAAKAAFRLSPNCADTVTNNDAGAAVPCPTVGISNAGGTQANSYEGALEITSRDARKIIVISYVDRPEGQWTGSMYYFGSFDTTGLSDWVNQTDRRTLGTVRNAFIAKWTALRNRNLGGGWAEFVAMLTSTREESWKYGLISQRCANLTGTPNPAAACYPYQNAGLEGLEYYVQDKAANPIPTGVSELPLAINLKIGSDPKLFVGRIESSTAMHYPGNPGVTMEFESSPADVSTCGADAGLADCVVYLKPKSTQGNVVLSAVGARYYPPVGESCAPGFTKVSVPWLVSPFTQGIETDTEGNKFRTECRDVDQPFAGSALVNSALAGGNPVPDGKIRKRTLEFIDGALVNQSELFVIFRESFESGIPGSSAMSKTSAYGYFRLKRAQANLDATSYTSKPTAPTSTRVDPINPGAQCSPTKLPDWIKSMGLALPPSATTPVSNWNSTQRTALARLLLEGSSVAANYTQVLNGGSMGTPVTQAGPTYVHYLCEGLGVINGGAGDNGSPTAVRLSCPLGSKVTYFLSNKTPSEMASEPCNTLVATGTTSTTIARDGGFSQTVQDKVGSCVSAFSQWSTNPLSGYVTEVDPRATCNGRTDNVNDVFCDDYRLDLRSGKTFYKRAAASTATNYAPLRSLIDAAFRYKTRFRSTSGGSLGFAPTVCVPNSQAIPYCFDPAEIEEARSRIDCLISMYDGDLTMDPTVRTALNKFLKDDFSMFKVPAGEGFERLYAELLIMQGDESLTSAYASRFDLAGVGGASFKGSAFETGGIDLTGVAGAEMFRLYQAVQYYQLALDRLYMLGPNFSTALTRGGLSLASNFVSNETMTEYLERLVRAASQKSRAWGEVARRYQNFNRPDLARAVIERAYVGTYMESALLSRLMQDLDAQGQSTYVAQNRITIEKTQRTYRMALLDMRDIYGQITDNQNFFGYPPDYIPFPALDGASTSSANAYETLKLLANQRLDLARTREQAALAAGKQGRVDAVQFQSDLTSIRNNYENQLASLCGTFVVPAENNRAYPAIRKYAALADVPAQMGDPCGRMGNGELHNAMAATKDSALKLQGVLLRHSNIEKEIDIERARIASQCQLTQDLADLQYTRQGYVISVNQEMAEARALATLISSSVSAVISSIEVLDCEIQCASSAAMGATVAATGIAAAVGAYATERVMAQKAANLQTYEAETMRLVSLGQCAAQQIDSTARVANLVNSLLEVQLEALRADYGMRVTMADVNKLSAQAKRLQAQQEEAEQLSIDLQQAQNDPNVRIYQNDAIINADVSFRDALATAYRLTLVYEYYTSSSYAKKEQLFLIRMIQAGQYNLENYLLELDNAFNTFEEQFGNPDLRVLALSLRDDVLRIPFLKIDGKAYTEAERIQMMQERLKDVRLLDGRGYLNLPFSTSLKSLSPLTRNHKIRHVEMDIQGNKLGDMTARLYLRMSGTGVVRNVSDEIDYFVFPERLAVVNTSLQGSKVYDPEVYRNYRFRDRPLVNTTWELVVNQRDEVANQDIDLQSLTDIRIIIYYSDFTAF